MERRQRPSNLSKTHQHTDREGCFKYPQSNKQLDNYTLHGTFIKRVQLATLQNSTMARRLTLTLPVGGTYLVLLEARRALLSPTRPPTAPQLCKQMCTIYNGVISVTLTILEFSKRETALMGDCN